MLATDETGSNHEQNISLFNPESIFTTLSLERSDFPMVKTRIEALVRKLIAQRYDKNPRLSDELTSAYGYYFKKLHERYDAIEYKNINSALLLLLFLLTAAFVILAPIKFIVWGFISVALFTVLWMHINDNYRQPGHALTQIENHLKAYQAAADYVLPSLKLARNSQILTIDCPMELLLRDETVRAFINDHYRAFYFAQTHCIKNHLDKLPQQQRNAYFLSLVLAKQHGAGGDQANTAVKSIITRFHTTLERNHALLTQRRDSYSKWFHNWVSLLPWGYVLNISVASLLTYNLFYAATPIALPFLALGVIGGVLAAATLCSFLYYRYAKNQLQTLSTQTEALHAIHSNIRETGLVVEAGGLDSQVWKEAHDTQQRLMQRHESSKLQPEAPEVVISQEHRRKHGVFYVELSAVSRSERGSESDCDGSSSDSESPRSPLVKKTRITH